MERRLQETGQNRSTAVQTLPSIARKDMTQKPTHIPQIQIYLLIHEYIASIRVKLYKTIKNIHSPIIVKFCNTFC